MLTWGLGNALRLGKMTKVIKPEAKVEFRDKPSGETFVESPSGEAFIETKGGEVTFDE